jgi:hypothetical protein
MINSDIINSDTINCNMTNYNMINYDTINYDMINYNTINCIQGSLEAMLERRFLFQGSHMSQQRSKLLLGLLGGNFLSGSALQ